MLKNRTFEGENVPKLTKWLFCSSGMFRDLVYQFVSMFLLMYAQYCGIGGTEDGADYIAMYSTITVIIIILRIWDGFNDPIMGFIVEKVHFKWGKYRPWIFLGALLSSIVTILMFTTQVHGWAYVGLFAVFYFLWDFTYTMNDIAFWSVLPSLSQKEKVRANLTTLLSIFVSIGSFTAGGLVPILSSNFGYTISYRWFAIIAAVLYFLSQLILVIFMKEKKRSEEVEESSEKMKFRDIFSVLIKNDQVRSSIVGILFYYTGASILVTLGLNYFYFNYGYTEAGTYQLLFTIVYALATIIGQACYPLLVNKLKLHRMQIFSAASIVTVFGYLCLFLYIFLNPVQFFPLLCVLGFIVFFAQTLISMVLYIMIQDSIEYNEYHFNTRRESAIFSLRAFTAKLGSSLQQVVLYVSLLAGALYGISNAISGAEMDAIQKFGENATEVGNYVGSIANSMTGYENVEFWQRLVYQIGFTIVPGLLMLACFIWIKKTYRITEENHSIMVEKLTKRTENENTKQ